MTEKTDRTLLRRSIAEPYASEELLPDFSTADPSSARFFISKCENSGIAPHNTIFADYFSSSPGRINPGFTEDIPALRWILLYISAASSSGHIRVDQSLFYEETKSLFTSQVTLKTDQTVDRELKKSDKLLQKGDIIARHPRLFGRTVSTKKESAGPLFEETEQIDKSDSTFPDSNSGDQYQAPIILSEDNNFFYTNKLFRLEKEFLLLLEKRCPPNSQAGPEPEPQENNTNRKDSELILSEEEIKKITEETLSRGRTPVDKDLIFRAVVKTLRNPILIISGGPGTGKTTIVTYLLQILKEISFQNKTPFKTALCAPTGRAASRIKESLSRELSDIDENDHQAMTLHKLLKIRPGNPSPYNKENPLPYHLVIVDEASMVDLALMKKLLDGLAPRTKLILVGDKDQLPSVETGALLADILYQYENPKQRLHDSVIMLEKVYRSEKEILNLAKKVIEGENEETLALLQNSKTDTQTNAVKWIDLSQTGKQGNFIETLLSDINGPEPDPKESFFDCPIEKREGVSLELLRSFKESETAIVLSPLRKGPFGTDRINTVIDKAICSKQGKEAQGVFISSGNYHGRRIMITQNDYKLGLFNGDRGIIFRFRDSFYAFFEETGKDTGVAGFRHFPVSSLTGFESANAVTIHKSQGSEWDRVAIILPVEASKLLKREIFYTALTRARKKATIYSSEEAITQAVKNRVIRHSGVREFVLPQTDAG